MEIIRKINLFSDGFRVLLSSFTLLQNQYPTLLCHIFHFIYVLYFLFTDASAALSKTFPFSLAQLALGSTLLSFSVIGKDERKIFLMISICVRTQQTKDPKKISSQIFPIIKIFLLFSGGIL